MGNQKTIRILIAEDDFLVSQSTAALLRTMGYAIVGQALNGREAVEMTQSLRPDVILMDIKMPVMDGIKATRRIYETFPTPVVALTAYATSEVIERAIAAGVGAYLTKPASPQEIERAINVTIARFDDMVELRRLNTELQTEIAERKRAEGALRESEEHYRTLFEQANDAIFLNREDDTIVDVNRRACEMLGYSREELLTMKVPDLQAPEVRGREGSVIRKELEYGGAPFETIDIHRDGTRIPVEVSTSRMTGGEEGLALAIVRDITERKRAEDALRESEERYRILFEQANDGIHSVNGNDEIIDVNPRMCEMMGYSRAELLTMRISDLQAPEVRGQAGSVIKGEIAHYGNTAFELVFRTFQTGLICGRIGAPISSLRCPNDRTVSRG